MGTQDALPNLSPPHTNCFGGARARAKSRPLSLQAREKQPRSHLFPPLPPRNGGPGRGAGGRSRAAGSASSGREGERGRGSNWSGKFQARGRVSAAVASAALPHGPGSSASRPPRLPPAKPVQAASLGALQRRRAEARLPWCCGSTGRGVCGGGVRRFAPLTGLERPPFLGLR